MKNPTKVTYVDIINKAISSNIFSSEDEKAKAIELKDMLVKRNANGNALSEEEKKERATISSAITSYLGTTSSATVGDILHKGGLSDYNIQRVTGRLRELCTDNKVMRVVDKGVAKYSLKS